MGSWGQHVGVAFNSLLSRVSGGRSGSRRELGLGKDCTEAVSTLDAVSSVRGPDESLGGRMVLQRRRSYVLDQQLDLGSRACAFRDSFFEERGHVQGRLGVFLRRLSSLRISLVLLQRLHFNRSSARCELRRMVLRSIGILKESSRCFGGDTWFHL